MRFGRSRSFKIDNFGTNRKRVCKFVLVVHRDYLAPFLRYGDLLEKLPIFPTRLSFGAPAPYVLFGISRWTNLFPSLFSLFPQVHEETRAMGLSSSEDRMIVAGAVLTWYRTVTDDQTESIIANTALCWRAVKRVTFFHIHITTPCPRKKEATLIFDVTSPPVEIFF